MKHKIACVTVNNLWQSGGLTSSLHPFKHVSVSLRLSACRTPSTTSDLLPGESRCDLRDIAPSLGESKTSGKLVKMDAIWGLIQPTCWPATSKCKHLARLEPGGTTTLGNKLILCNIKYEKKTVYHHGSKIMVVRKYACSTAMYLLYIWITGV